MKSVERYLTDEERKAMALDGLPWASVAQFLHTTQRSARRRVAKAKAVVEALTRYTDETTDRAELARLRRLRVRHSQLRSIHRELMRRRSDHDAALVLGLRRDEVRSVRRQIIKANTSTAQFLKATRRHRR